MKIPAFILVISICLIGFGSGTVREPMKATFKNSASYRWLNKKVVERRVLDDMESMSNWSGFTTGSEAVADARVIAKAEETSNVAEISLTTERKHDGNQSLMMRTPTKLEGPGPKNGREWGRSKVRRHFNGEDWTQFNRLSL
ncbi:MAG TPA: hypothetical protein VGZ71_00690, partial [Puia sp.]|nr:hypothetical protein [Puia sp.]